MTRVRKTILVRSTSHTPQLPPTYHVSAPDPAPVIFVVNGYVSPGLTSFKFTPDGNFWPDGIHPTPLEKAKATLELQCPMSGSVPGADAVWEKYTSTAKLIEDSAPDVQGRLHQGFLSGKSLKFGHLLFRVSRTLLVFFILLTLISFSFKPRDDNDHLASSAYFVCFYLGRDLH